MSYSWHIGKGLSLVEFPNIVIVLVDPENPGNVGFVTRALANFGVQELRVVGEDIREDQYAQMFSVRAHHILDNARFYDELGDVLLDIDAAWAATARSGRNHSVTRATVPLTELPDPTSLVGKVAIIFGRESTGLFNDEIELCDLAFTIPTSEEYPSLNLSHAVSITLYHLFAKYAPEEPRKPSEARAATWKEREQVYRFFDEVVDQLNLKEFRVPIAKQVFRNLLGRAYMTGREVSTLTGVVRRINELVYDKKVIDD
ncbi:MAG: RNA methyltransferase [Candidatus Thorarchaeota archaeon]